MAHEMADAANGVLRQIVFQKIPIDIERVKETQQQAFGNGSGIV